MRGDLGKFKIQTRMRVWFMFSPCLANLLIMVFASLKIRSGFLVPVFGLRKSTVPVMFHFVPEIQEKIMIVTVFPGSNFTQCEDFVTMSRVHLFGTWSDRVEEGPVAFWRFTICTTHPWRKIE